MDTIPDLRMGTISDLMTADEITQLLYDRNIVFLFNENIPCEEHDRVLLSKEDVWDKKAGKVTHHVYKDRLFDGLFRNRVQKYSLNQSSDNLTTNIQNFMDSVMSLLQDIKNSDMCNQTIFFDDGFLRLFTRMLDMTTWHEVMYYNYLSNNSIAVALKLELQESYMHHVHSVASDDVDLNKLPQDCKQWYELVSAIFECSYIHIMTYHPKDKQALVDYWQAHNSDETINDFGNEMFLNGVTEFILRHHLPARERSAEYSSRYGLPESVLSYLRESLDLFIDPKSIHYLVQ
ncbi:MAG: hypothetical protein J5965_21980 [Aeriscardovia sp.]|nr:hypothetical protein [Aeriscardovia sp.]